MGEHIVLCDQAGLDYFCVVTQIEKSKVHCKITSSQKNAAEPSVRVHLFQALPKADKMAEIIEKCVELGIDGITPVVAARCVAKPSPRENNKTERGQKIAEAAAKQSGRGKIPKINAPIALDEAIRLAKTHGASFVCYELEKDLHLKDFLRKTGDINNLAFFIGPEGGFTGAEAALFKQNAIPAVTLGPRILRTQTAGPAVLANILYELERKP